MRFAARGLIGLTLALAALALVALAAVELRRSVVERADAPRPVPAERVFAVPVDVLRPVTARPHVTAFGEIRSWRTLQLAAPMAGRVAWVAPGLRDGAAVAAGATLIRLDPADQQMRLDDARVALQEARADAAEARQSVRSAELERDAALTQRDLRAATLARQRALAGRGVASGSVVDEAEIALAAAEQALAARGQALLTAQMRIGRADLAVARAELALREAERRLADTTIAAPFDGLAAEVSVAAGDVVSANQRLGALIDPAALEAALHVAAADMARLVDDAGALIPAAVEVRLELGDGGLSAPGTLERQDAVAGQGRTGRTVFARLAPDPHTVLRPGDFVSARIAEPPLEGVAILPAAAATGDGRILILDADDRLREVAVTILRRDGDSLIVGGAPFGARYVTARAPQLGPGLKARPVGDAPPAIAGAGREAGG